MSMMDLNGIAIFVAVVEAGSFTGGAKTLQIPKGSISRKISRLEKDLGVRLLNRTTRSVTLTEVGRVYYEQCRNGLSTLEYATQRLDDIRSEPSGTLRISAPLDFGPDRFGEIVDAYLKKYDKVNIELILTDHFLDLVEHRIDLAIRIGTLEDSSLVARKLGAGRAILCASPTYLKQHGTPTLLQDLRFHDCIVHGRSAENAVWHLKGVDGVETVRMKCRVAGCNMSHALKLIINGHGIGFLPETVVKPEIKLGRLVQVLDQYMGAEFGLYAVYPSNRQISQSVRAFLDLAVEWSIQNSGTSK